MKIKTLILTFFMMMSSPFLFGQHWVDPTLPGEDVMTVTAKVTLDGELQSGESYEVAVFNGDKLVEVGTFTNHDIPELAYHVGLTIPGEKGDKFYFKFFNGTNEYVSLTEIDYADQQGSHLNLFTIEFKSVASLNNVIYSSLQDAIDACTTGDNTITLLQNISDVVTVTEKTDVNVIIDGANKEYTGQIKIHGNSTYENSKLTIQNVAFKTSVAEHDFIWCDGSANGDYSRYCQNVTVDNCSFTAEGAAVNTAVAARFRAAKNFTMTNCTAENLHSLMQTRGTDGITIENVTVSNCKNGIAVGTSTNVAISGSTISATGYGVRADGDGAYTMTLTDNTISAELPVVVRKAMAAYNLTIAGDNNNYTAYNENAYQVVFTTGDDGTYEAPTTGQFVLTAPENFNVYPVYVAQVGDKKYTSVVTAINEAADGATVQLLPGTIDEYVYPWPESNHSKEKSITIVGAENYGTTLTAGMFLGYDDSQCREHNITVKGINFTGKGLTVACQQNVVIEDNKFNNITEGRAIAVIGKNINSVVKNNVIDNVTTSQVGIELRNTLTATVTGNTISNTGHNSLQITSQEGATESTITVTNNTMSNWGEGGEGRAMRINDIVTANINGNVMTHDAAPEEFVKVIGSTALDASANYWNGISPLTDGMFTGVEGDLVPVLVSYYTDAEKTNLVELAPSVAKIGDVYYQSLQDAIDAATEGQTITLIDDITIATETNGGYFQINEDDKIVIDLNGKNITVTESANSNFYLFLNYGELTLNDSQNSAVVELTATNNRAWSAQSTIVLNRGGVLNINGGKYVHKGGTDMAITICNSANSFGPAYLYVNGGEIISETYIGVRMRMENPAANGNPGNDISYMYVTDGYIYGLNRGIWGQKSTGANEKQGELVVTGGTIENATADRGAIQFDTDSYEAQNVVATISGDAFIKGQVIAGKDEMSITGGTFTTDVTEYCAFGYTCQANGDGTYGVVETEGFEIPNLDRLIAFRNAVNAGNTFKNQTVTVTADIIDLDGINWTPIGTEATPFMGTFDGGNNTIKNLNVVVEEGKEDKAYIGLFGYANGVTIKNLNFENVNLNIACLDIDHSQGHIGAVAGSLEGTSTIENVTVKGNIKVEATFDANGASRVAVVAGGNSSGNVTMRNVHVNANEGSYLKANNNVGALAGQLQDKNVFENCSSNIDVTAKKFFAGGLIGLAAGDSKFIDCHTTGDVTVTAGREGRANDHYRVGGIAGGWADGKTMVCTLTNCTYTGKISGTNADGSVVTFFDYAGYVGRGYGLTNCAGSKVIIDDVEYVQAYNTNFGVYEINGNVTLYKAEDLKAFAKEVNGGNSHQDKNVVLAADIDLNNENWTPIGTEATPFMGTFDGGNFTISNLKAEGEKYVGLFGYANKATIKNVKIENANVYGVESVGALAGSVYSESTIENCHVSGLIQVEGLTKVGGIHGYGYAKIINSSVVGSDDSYIKGTYVQADQEGDNVGGIVGHGGEGNTIEACTVKDIKVIGTRKVGGIVGTTDRAKVLDNCLVDGVVIENTAEATYAEDNAATTTIGGLIGNYHGGGKGGSVINCVVKNVTFTVGNAKNVGPIVGGYRLTPNEEPTDVTASGNLIYMGTISDNTTNTYLMHAVAQIGETKYYTLQEAVDAGNDETINVIGSTTEEITIAEGANITLDFAENVTLDGYIAPFNGNLTVNGGTINNTNPDYSAIEINSGNLTLSNVNVTSARHAVRIDGAVTATIDGGEYRLNATSRTLHAVNVSGAANVTIKAGTFVGPKGTSVDSGSAVCVQAGATVTIEGGDFSGGKNATLGVSGTMTVTGGTFDQDPTAYVAQGYVVKYNETASRYEVFLGVAKIEGKDEIYGTLAEAVNAAEQGNTIILLADINENVTIKNKKLTIDGGGFNSTGYFSTNISTSYPLTFQNFNIDGAANYFVRVDGGGGNYTFDNCNIKNSWGIIYTIKATNTVTIKNSTVDNCSYGVGHFVALNSAIIENVTVTNSTRGVYVQNQASKTVTFKNCNISATTPFGIWEKSTYVITFNIEGKTDVNNVTLNTGDYYKYVLSAEGAKLIGAQEGLDITTTVEGCIVKYEEGETEGFGTYSVIPGNVELVRGEDSVGKFATIQEAIDAAQNGDVVRIVSEDTFVMDITTGVTNSDNYYVLANVAEKEVVIDLNGKAITVDVTNLPEGCKNDMLMAVFCADVNGKLTLRDSGENGSVSVTGGATKTVYSMVMAYEGLVNIESGSYSIDYMNEGRGMIYDNVSDHAGEDGSNLNQGVNISGGNFTLGNVGTLANGSPWILAASGSNNGKYVYVTGGTYNDDILHQHWAFEVLAPVNKALQNNGDGTYSIVDAVAFVRQHEYSGYYTETGYATLEEAFMRAHTAGDIITLLQNIELAEGITVNADQEVVLDLNGMTLSQEKECTKHYEMIRNNGTLTIKDSTEEAQGKISFKDTSAGDPNFGWGSYTIGNYGTLVVENGTIENISTQNPGNGQPNVHTYCAIQQGHGAVSTTINGGTISNQTYRSIRTNTGALVINGGNIIGQVWVQPNQGNATLEITDGEFDPTGNDGSSVFMTNEGENYTVTSASITGGFFNTKIGATDPTKEGVAGCVTGGTFTTAAKDNTNAALINENFAFVDNGNDTWTVMPTQEQSLLNGWNWYSTYLDITLNDLTNALGDNGISIKNFNGNTKENNGGLWMGTLNEINPSEMYMIQTTAECDLKLAADLVNPNDHIISLNDGWSWIGYPSNQEVAINVALANIPEPKEGDIIKSLNGYAEYAYGLWLGTINTMVPGVGYKYNNKSGEAKTFYYNIEATRGAVEANVTAENNYWTPNATKYPHNMTMTAVVDGLTNGNYEVAAFVNGEVRGSARPIYVEALDAHIFFLTIHGEDVEEMSFRLYDIDTDTEYALNDRINYSNDAHLGSVNEPYVFSRGTTGIGEAALSEINIYPNPTTTGSTIRLQNTCDKVEVYNALGVLVAEYHNVDSIDALETAGIYVIRITNDGNTQNCRLVVR